MAQPHGDSTARNQMIMIKKIIIVGGGFAGWYTAAALRNNLPDIELIVIDSERHSRLGVGETLGWSAPYDWKKLLGLKDDRLLMYNTGAIYKYGVTMENFWGDNTSFGYGKFFNLKVKALTKFYGEFDYKDFHEPWNKKEGEVGVQDAWLSLNQNNDKNFDDYIDELNEASHFLKNPWAPYDKNNNYVLRNQEGWSYQIDAEQTVSFLKDLSLKNNNNITHINSPVIGVELTSDNNVSQLVLENKQKITGDIFIDASGFYRVLMKHVKNDTWTDAEEECCNSAWVCPTRHVDPKKEIIGGTIIHGEDDGWRFKVNLYHRAGNGYIFNNTLVDSNKPLEILLEKTNGARLADPKLLTWKPGCYKTPWQNNVIPLGISAYFIDPFDAPSFDVHSRALEDLLNSLKYDNLSSARDNFNSKQKIVFEERNLRLLFNFGLSQRSGKFWDSRRELAQKNNGMEIFKDIINQKREDIDSRLSWFWYQMYYRMCIASGTDRKKFDVVKLSLEDAEMSQSFFNYNKSRNQYIAKQPWPNYYEWLKENRFNGLSSDEILIKLHPKFAKDIKI